MTKRFAVVYEARADLLIATQLADRELCDAIDWLDPDLLSDQRAWVDANTIGVPLTWKSLKHLALQAGIRAHGHFNDGEPGLPDATATRRAVDYLLEEYPDLDAIVLIRDQDAEPERRGGLEQARRDHRDPVTIVIGMAIVEREAWVLCGFEPLDTDESERLSTERSHLGFDPRLKSHELTACKDDNAKRSPKRVLKQLIGDSPERECQCWQQTALDTLRKRGGDNGLAEFLSEVRNRLATMIGHVSNDQGQG